LAWEFLRAADKPSVTDQPEETHSGDEIHITSFPFFAAIRLRESVHLPGFIPARAALVNASRRNGLL
jgi:hypothetical protein